MTSPRIARTHGRFAKPGSRAAIQAPLGRNRRHSQNYDVLLKTVPTSCDSDRLNNRNGRIPVRWERVCSNFQSDLTSFKPNKENFRSCTPSTPGEQFCPKNSTCGTRSGPTVSSLFPEHRIGRNLSSRKLFRLRPVDSNRACCLSRRHRPCSSVPANACWPTVSVHLSGYGKTHATWDSGDGNSTVRLSSCVQNWNWQHGTAAVKSSGRHLLNRPGIAS